MRVDLIDVHVSERSRGWNVDDPLSDGGDEPVFEDRWYSLAVSGYDRAKRYAVRVGDEFLKLASREFLCFIYVIVLIVVHFIKSFRVFGGFLRSCN